MKKFFTLISMALVAMSINAQTESWYVNNEDGTLKAAYVANADANAMSVVKFSTANGRVLIPQVLLPAIMTAHSKMAS